MNVENVLTTKRRYDDLMKTYHWHVTYKNFNIGKYKTKKKAKELGWKRFRFYLQDTGEFGLRMQKEFKEELE